MFCRRYFLWTSLFAVGFFLLLPGCGEQTEGYVYVDNGSREPIEVEVDGKKVATVRPGRSKKLTLDLGPREFRVTSGDRVVYEETLTLDYGDRPFRRPTYVLNPDNSNRYLKTEIVYGDDTLTREGTDAMVSLISNLASHNKEGLDDEQKRKQWELDRKVRSKYRSIARDLVAFGDGPFFQIEMSGYILEPMPNMVVGSRHSSNSSRSTLIRVPKEIHDYVEHAVSIEEPTQEDLERLFVAQRVIESLVPFK